MRNNPTPPACGMMKIAVRNPRQLDVPRRRPAMTAAARRGGTNAADQDYFVAVGDITYQVSITTVNGMRWFQLMHS